MKRWMIGLVLAAAAAALGAGPASAQEPETPLDRAVEAGFRDPDQQQAFYDLFLETPLFILTANEEPVAQGEVAQLRLNSSLFRACRL